MGIAGTGARRLAPKITPYYDVACYSSRLPDEFAPAAYVVERSWRLRPVASAGKRLPYVLKPINVILVRVLDTYNTTDLYKVVRDGFDMEHCRVAIYVNSNLTFDYRLTEHTQRCATRRQIQLRSCAFTGVRTADAIHVQLKRILKYVRHGFTW